MASRRARPDSQTDSPASTPDLGGVRASEFARTLLAQLAGRRDGTARYALGEEIGRGGMGRVLAAHDRDLHRDVALKVIREDKLAADDSDDTHARSIRLARFLEEAQVTGQLDHPGIVPVHELGLDASGRLFFAMKLVRGDDLSRVLELAREGLDDWSETRVVGVLLKVCEALAYAHEKRVIHRDLKPSNIRIGRFGAVYVTDWGLARVLGRDDGRDLRVRELEPASSTAPVYSRRADSEASSSLLHTVDGTPIGTPMFMSPEQAMGRVDRMGPQTDVYGVGAILYTLLTGRTPYVSPFTQVEPLQIVQWIREGPPEPVLELAPRATPELVAICEKAMQRDPAARYADMSELAGELRNYLESRVVRAYRSGPWTELRLWIRRNRAVAASLALVGITLAGATSSVAWMQSLRSAEAELRVDELSAAQLLRSAPLATALDASRGHVLDDWLTHAQALAAKTEAVQARLESVRESALAARRAESIERVPEPELLESLREARGWLAEFEYGLDLAKAALASGERSERMPDPEDAARLLPREIEYWRERVRDLEWRTKARPALVLHDEGEQRRFDALFQLAIDLERLRRDAIPRIEQRRELAQSLASLAERDPGSAASWRLALESITNPVECPAYRAGIPGLAPIAGLTPLRRNPESGLWEFWHVASGARPQLDDRGRWRIEADTGIVLVLLPAALVTLGRQSTDPAGERYEASADDSSRPWKAKLAAFFVGAHELTQGQWLALGGGTESTIFAGRFVNGGPRTSRSHPVESISWYEACERLAAVGLQLPTEAQLEYAARAGSELPYVVSGDSSALQGRVNAIGREAAPQAGGVDRYPFHSPVGAFEPNAFGLYDTLGNVAEWCVDDYVEVNLSATPEPGTGRRSSERPRWRVIRGGDFNSSLAELSASWRSQFDPRARDSAIGMRPVLMLQAAQ